MSTPVVLGVGCAATIFYFLVACAVVVIGGYYWSKKCYFRRLELNIGRVINTSQGTSLEGHYAVKNLTQELVSFLLAGGFATVLQYAVLALGTGYLDWPASVASGAGYLTGAVLSYLLNYFFTFVSDRQHVQAISRFLTMVAVGWCLTMVLMALLVDIMSWNKWLSQVLTTGFVLTWNFLISRTWVFSRIKL